MQDFKIIFMGTPDFAAESLKALCENNLNIVAVITAPDRKAGRGQKLRQSAVKEYALTQDIPVLQPTNLKSPEFIEKLKSYEADLQIVVAFRMLPEVVWGMPQKGTVNLHASLLPHYRGAAPINYAIIKGEKTTGITTFFIEKEIDTGKVIFREEVEILARETAGELHDKLMVLGSNLIVKTANAVLSGNYASTDQTELLAGEEPKLAPKIFKEDCKINWEQPVQEIDFFIRGLSPYPAAWSELKHKTTGKILSFKIFDIDLEETEHSFDAGTIFHEDKSELEISAKGGYLKVNSLQIAGKKRLKTADLLRGFTIGDYEIVR